MRKETSSISQLQFIFKTYEWKTFRGPHHNSQLTDEFITQFIPGFRDPHNPQLTDEFNTKFMQGF